MVTDCKLIFLTPPALERSAREQNLPAAHLAYRVGGGPHLFRANLPVAARGGILAMDCEGFDGRGEPSAFCQEVLRECSARGFQGVYCAFPDRPIPVLQRAVAELGEALQRRGWPLYVPECYGAASDHACVLIPTALSGGSLEQRLAEAAEQYGPSRLALRIERLAQDFLLPSPTGEGVPLSRPALAQQLEERGGSVFFSHELCAHYFTYMTKTDGAHFVLFDDAGSIRKKCQLGARMGISHAFVPYAQVDDLLPGLLE